MDKLSRFISASARWRSTTCRPFGWVLFAALSVALSAGGCSGAGKSDNLPVDALHDAIATRVGDPNTCVLLADAASGKILYRYGEPFNCVRGLPACDRPGMMSASQALSLAIPAGGRAASCPSSGDGSRMVGWAEGRVVSHNRGLIYSVMMEGERALPGHEIAARLDDAFRAAGLRATTF